MVIALWAIGSIQSRWMISLMITSSFVTLLTPGTYLSPNRFDQKENQRQIWQLQSNLTFARKQSAISNLYCWDFIVSEEHKLILYQVWKKMTRFFWPSFVTKQPEFLPMIYLVASYEVNLSAFLLFKTTAFSWQRLKSLNHLHKKRKHFPLSFPNNLY